MTTKLPGVLAEIAELIGEAGALAIAARVGGTRIYLPATLDDDHWLVAAIGADQAKKLCKHFAVEGKRGQRIEIPLAVGGTYRQYLRRVQQRIHELDEEGFSATVIARKVGTTERAVHRARAKHRGSKPGDRQRSLF